MEAATENAYESAVANFTCFKVALSEGFALLREVVTEEHSRKKMFCRYKAMKYFISYR